MPSPQPIAFERLVVLFNPRSSNAAKAEKILVKLKAAYPNKVITEAIGRTEETNRRLLMKNLRSGDILVVCGGDGTISSMVNCLLGSGMPPELRRIPVLPVGTGRMNDTARMLNGRRYSNPGYVLKRGKRLSVYPLLCVCTPLSGKGKPLVKSIIYYMGFGMSGTASYTWNDPDFRAKISKRPPVARDVEFFKAGSILVRDSKYFDITYKGKRRAVLDIAIANGHIAGGYYRLPTRLSQRRFFFELSDDKSFLHTFRTVVELLTNQYRGGLVTQSVNFTLHDPIPGHLGGEPFLPPAPCQVSITYHKQPIYMLATNPKA